MACEGVMFEGRAREAVVRLDMLEEWVKGEGGCV